MSNPISGDKLLSAIDVKLSQTKQHKQQAPSQNDAPKAAAKESTDSLQLSHSQAQTESRPLSETLSNGQQAQNALQNLLNRMQSNPEQAMQAQAQVPQFQADTLLSASAS